MCLDLIKQGTDERAKVRVPSSPFLLLVLSPVLSPVLYPVPSPILSTVLSPVLFPLLSGLLPFQSSLLFALLCPLVPLACLLVLCSRGVDLNLLGWHIFARILGLF